MKRFFNDYKLPIVIIRPPTVYGPGDQPEVVTNIIKMVYKRQFFMLGDGESLRNLCYIDNLIQGIFLAEENKNSIGKVFFIADDEVYTFNQLLHEVAKEERVELRKFHLPKFIGNISGFIFRGLANYFGISFMPLYALWTMVFDLAFDISNARKELGFYPRVSLKEGIKNTVPYYLKKESI
jgi:nucleoside-diphosphate-sugar epimerase